MKSKFLMYILLLVMADMTSAANRKMLAIEDNKLLGDRISSKENEKVVVKENSADSSGEPDVNNHHSIPRQSFGGYTNNQNGPPESP
ncbi:hypothetical protein POPTR_016G098300v4 [Populus trichocarpa]|uniref:Uncharacterized protein n=1 Tax=Populus trichocarpa TaxID=3694 RepID=A0ACC0RTA8_POPTR|nr:hypothetical protein POPTR_016G098300v4 [Populus trichocarpa]